MFKAMGKRESEFVELACQISMSIRSPSKSIVLNKMASFEQIEYSALWYASIRSALEKEV
jgi:hypothetical protein